MFKSGDKVIVKGVPFNHKRVDYYGTVLGLLAYETTMYRIQLLSGRIIVVSDSMLELIKG